MTKVIKPISAQIKWTSLCLTVLMFFGLFSHYANAAQSQKLTSATLTKTNQSSLTPRKLNQIIKQIDSYYVDEVNVNSLLENALKEVFKQLDPHSTYLNESDLNSLFEMANGQYNGLGVEVEVRNELLVILATIKNSPAEFAGLQKGDIISHINGIKIKGKTLAQVSRLIKDSAQKTILTVTRDFYDQALDFALEKAKIEVQSVTPRLLDHNIGYLKIYSFQSSTTDDLFKAIEQLKSETTDGLAGLILDLRDNPGGVLDSAVGVSDLFLNQGTIVTTRGRFSDANHNFSATPGDVLSNKPIYVLINKGSASASEIVAGALKENNRATIVGVQSFGKGSVQSLIPLGNGSTAIKLTTALYFTPDGLSINGIGIKPDIEIHQQQVNQSQQSPIMGLSNDWGPSGKMLANRDFQLDEAEKLVLKQIHH
jgi:carboxyl-terminal processing protease